MLVKDMVLLYYGVGVLKPHIGGRLCPIFVQVLYYMMIVGVLKMDHMEWIWTTVVY